MGICSSQDDNIVYPMRVGPVHQKMDLETARQRWAARFPETTRSYLEKQRAEFWETRVQGLPEIWQALHEAVRNIHEPATAKQIMKNAGINMYFELERTSEVFVYDQYGFKYQIPMFCLFDPSNLLEVARVAQKSAPHPDDGKLISFFIRYSSQEASDLKVECLYGSTILAMKQLGQKERKINVNRQTAVYQGKKLSDIVKLSDILLSPGVFLQIFVTPETGIDASLPGAFLPR